MQTLRDRHCHDCTYVLGCVCERIQAVSIAFRALRVDAEIFTAIDLINKISERNTMK